MVMESFKGNAPDNKSFGRASVPSARLRAQTAILYYRVPNSPVPVGSRRHSSETGGHLATALNQASLYRMVSPYVQMELAGGFAAEDPCNSGGGRGGSGHFITR